jgi:hypothetical protein
MCRYFNKLADRVGGEALRIWVDASCARPRSGGVVLGNTNVGKMVTEATAARDADLRPILEAMRDRPLPEIAMELTNRNIPTPRGGDAWSQVTVMRSMRRLGIAAK